MKDSVETLCLTCGKQDGKCSWQKKIVPVDGWVADKSIVKSLDRHYETYRVKYCPLYEYYGACLKCRDYKPSDNIKPEDYKNFCKKYKYDIDMECKRFRHKINVNI